MVVVVGVHSVVIVIYNVKSTYRRECSTEVQYVSGIVAKLFMYFKY